MPFCYADIHLKVFFLIKKIVIISLDQFSIIFANTKEFFRMIIHLLATQVTFLQLILSEVPKCLLIILHNHYSY